MMCVLATVRTLARLELLWAFDCLVIFGEKEGGGKVKGEGAGSGGGAGGPSAPAESGGELLQADIHPQMVL